MTKTPPIPYSMASGPARERLTKVNIFSREDPESVFSKFPHQHRKYLLALEESKDGLRMMKTGERMVRELFRPTADQARLRLNFWDEYARSLDSGAFMRWEYIPSGATSFETFMEFIEDPVNMGYLCNVPPHYAKAAEEILLAGLERLRDIIELPLVDSKGRAQAPVIAGVIKAVDMLDKRVKGAIMQKLAVHQHHTMQQFHNAQGEIEVGASPEQLAHNELKSLEKQIAEVRKKMSESYAMLENRLIEVGTVEADDGEEEES